MAHLLVQVNSFTLHLERMVVLTALVGTGVWCCFAFAIDAFLAGLGQKLDARSRLSEEQSPSLPSISWLEQFRAKAARGIRRWGVVGERHLRIAVQVDRSLTDKLSRLPREIR